MKTSPLPDAAYYKVSREFHDTVVEWNSRHPAAGDPEFLDKLNRYHLGGNRSGIDTVRKIEFLVRDAGVTMRGSRFLDLGCGTGGCLLAASSAGAAYCEGWEINNTKLELAELNIGTLLKERTHIKVLKRSAEDPLASNQAVEPFELVCCEQVLEHVKDLDNAAATMATLLAPGNGVAYVSVPNGFSCNNVIKEPHLLVFGLSLLDRIEGGELARAIKNHTHYADMMGGYRSYRAYKDVFAANGLLFRPVHKMPALRGILVELEGRIEQISALQAQKTKEWKEIVPAGIIESLNTRLADYTSKAENELQQTMRSPAGSDVRKSFVTDYGVDTFEFLVFNEANTRLARQRPKILDRFRSWLWRAGHAD